jgi:hypothetical protein
VDPTIPGMVTGAVLPIAGAAAGYALSAEDRAKAEALRQQALEQYLGLNAGSPDAVLQGDTAFNGAAADPEAVAAQRAALRGLADRANGDGYSVEDRAAMAQAQQAANANEASSRASLMRDAEARGVGGSNLSMASQLAAQQGANDRLNQAGMQISAEGRRRALQALQSMGQMAGGMRGQSFDEAAARAQAQDAINRFNAGAQNSQRNTYTDNQYRNANARAGGYAGMADASQANADQTLQTFTQMGAGAGKGATGTADYFTKKKDD